MYFRLCNIFHNKIKYEKCLALLGIVALVYVFSSLNSPTQHQKRAQNVSAEVVSERPRNVDVLLSQSQAIQQSDFKQTNILHNILTQTKNSDIQSIEFQNNVVNNVLKERQVYQNNDHYEKNILRMQQQHVFYKNRQRNNENNIFNSNTQQPNSYQNSLINNNMQQHNPYQDNSLNDMQQRNAYQSYVSDNDKLQKNDFQRNRNPNSNFDFSMNQNTHYDFNTKQKNNFDFNLNQNKVQKYDVHQMCVMPSLDVNDPVMLKFYKEKNRIRCPSLPEWAFVENGTVRFSEEARQMYGNFTCDFYPIVRGPGDSFTTYGFPVLDIQDGFQLVSDFFRLSCQSREQRWTHEAMHAGVSVNQTIKDRLKLTKPPANGLGLSVALLGFDSMSRMSWLRRMPKTREYLVNTLKAIELEGYNILGDGTPAALLPILTGKHEHELPEARRGKFNAQPVDVFPWLWNDFRGQGYVTSWADADVDIAPFNYRMLGFKHQPTDYFMRPFYLATKLLESTYNKFCHGPIPKHMVWLNWIRDVFYMYKDDPKFMVHFYTPLSHEDNNLITIVSYGLLTNLFAHIYLRKCK